MEAKDLNKSTTNGMDLNSEHNTENTLQNPPAEENADTRSSSDQNSEATTPKEEETKEEPVVNKTEPAEAANQSEEKKEAPTVLEPVDHIMLSKEKLVERFKSVLKDFPVDQVRDEVEAIKSAFYKKHKAEVEDLKKKFVESGELEENFAPPIDHLELEIKELLKTFRENKAEFNHRIEADKEKNYQIKLSVIEGIKALINRQESLNETFQEFRELQNKWHEAGPVPQDKLRDLWQTYNYHIENFYNYIKINKELRDLDLKKNMKAKLELCEKAENLLLEPTIIKAFKTLQKFHEQWREIGPVPHDKKDELWTRFKEATSKINKRHQDYFEGLKDQLQKNLQAKTELCEKAETIAELHIDNPKEWEAKSLDLIELQQIWKTIGFAPKKDNNTIYDRFRTACDKFFDNKREYFKDYKSEQQNNLQLKTELCIQAEGMKDNKDWRKTTDEFIAIQRKWKEIGPVPRKHSDAIWKRFRTACDAFFENKSHFFNHIDEEHDHNLVLKQELIEEVKTYNPSQDSEENFKHLQEFQRRWSDIGHVPLADKDHINQEFRNLINQYFDNLNMDEFNKSLQKFRNKLENYKSSDNSSEKITQERNKIINKLKQLESDITLWENNIGFFAKSKKSEALVKDFNHKIENGKRNIKLLNRKLDMLDKFL